MKQGCLSASRRCSQLNGWGGDCADILLNIIALAHGEKTLSQHIHILGICGTFMGGVALLARALGCRVSGSDAGAYPPMSGQLAAAGIEVKEGYSAEPLSPPPDLVIVGNALSRGNPAVEYMLEARIPYQSGPQWLAENVLRGRRVLAVAGTHGKTTASSILAWILECAGMNPGFLIGGVPANFGVSARLGGECFVVEADEYDTAFFDKRSKFIHYRPDILCLNNLEFDHGDIFPDLEAIKTQFHHLLRTVPGNGQIIRRAGDAELEDVLRRGCWTPVETFEADAPAGRGTGQSVVDENGSQAGRGTGESPADDGGDPADWRALKPSADGGAFTLSYAGIRSGAGRGAGASSGAGAKGGADANGGPGANGSASHDLPVQWRETGRHNLENALSAAAAAHAAGASLEDIRRGLETFQGVKRRMELLAEVDGIRIYDDFAHHPTAIAAALAGLRARVDGQSQTGANPANTGKAGKGKPGGANAGKTGKGKTGKQTGNPPRIIALIEPRSRTMRLGHHQAALPQAVAAADAVFWHQPPDLDWNMDALTKASPVPAVRCHSTGAIIEGVLVECRPGDHIVIMSNGSFGGIHHALIEKLRAARKA